MSATPIPRTLMMTAYGDLDVSRLTQKPPGRHPVDTRTVALERIEDVVAAVGRALARKARSMDVSDGRGKRDRRSRRRRGADKTSRPSSWPRGLRARPHQTIQKTAQGPASPRQLDLFVATTVIEVGWMCPRPPSWSSSTPSVSVSRMYKARPHRGGDKPSTCLVVQSPLGDVRNGALSILRETEDGLRIAEEDLRCSPWQSARTPQSGLPTLRLADLAIGELVAIAMRSPPRAQPTPTWKAARPACARSCTCSVATKPSSTCGPVEISVDRRHVASSHNIDAQW